MSIGNCKCIDRPHKIKLIKALETEIYRFDIEYNSMQQNKEKWDRSFEKGEVSVSSDELLNTIKQNRESFQSTLNEIKSIAEC